MAEFTLYNERSGDDKRVRRTKYFIQTALLELLEQKKIQDISVTELTAKADVNRKTFYNHYATPEDVLRELEENLVDSFFQFVDADKEALVSNPREMILQLANQILDNRGFCARLVHSGEIRYLLDKTRDHFLGYMSKLISSRYEVEPARLPYLIDYTVNGVVAVLEAWLFDPESLTAEELADLVGSLISATLSTLPQK